MTREEAWEELKETIIEMRNNDGIGTQQEVCKFLTNLIAIIEMQITDDWIPIDEKLPEISGNYWCTFGGTNLTGKDYYLTELDAKKLFDDEKYAGWESQNVIAWMPLPKPYKPKESENRNENNTSTR